MTDPLRCPSCSHDRIRFTEDGAWCICTPNYEDTDETEIRFCPFCGAGLSGPTEAERAAVDGVSRMARAIGWMQAREQREQERAARAARNWSEPYDRLRENMDRLTESLDLQVTKMLLTRGWYGAEDPEETSR